MAAENDFKKAWRNFVENSRKNFTSIIFFVSNVHFLFPPFGFIAFKQMVHNPSRGSITCRYP